MLRNVHSHGGGGKGRKLNYAAENKFPKQQMCNVCGHRHLECSRGSWGNQDVLQDEQCWWVWAEGCLLLSSFFESGSLVQASLKPANTASFLPPPNLKPNPSVQSQEVATTFSLRVAGHPPRALAMLCEPSTNWVTTQSVCTTAFIVAVCKYPTGRKN